LDKKKKKKKKIAIKHGQKFGTELFRTEMIIGIDLTNKIPKKLRGFYIKIAFSEPKSKNPIFSIYLFFQSTKKKKKKNPKITMKHVKISIFSPT
jgi:hypothetical protein